MGLVGDMGLNGEVGVPGGNIVLLEPLLGVPATHSRYQYSGRHGAEW